MTYWHFFYKELLIILQECLCDLPIQECLCDLPMQECLPVYSAGASDDGVPIWSGNSIPWGFPIFVSLN